tara:strand:+ start:1180 stop:1338 length:159 start_codon:yes stop_codon:yes gene_type:complete
MEFNFNEEQIELIQDILVIQKNIWLEDKNEYKPDIELIEQCQEIINKIHKDI